MRESRFKGVDLVNQLIIGDREQKEDVRRAIWEEAMASRPSVLPYTTDPVERKKKKSAAKDKVRQKRRDTAAARAFFQTMAAASVIQHQQQQP